jgi:hypothetical protein
VAEAENVRVKADVGLAVVHFEDEVVELRGHAQDLPRRSYHRAPRGRCDGTDARCPRDSAVRCRSRGRSGAELAFALRGRDQSAADMAAVVIHGAARDPVLASYGPIGCPAQRYDAARGSRHGERLASDDPPKAEEGVARSRRASGPSRIEGGRSQP